MKQQPQEENRTTERIIVIGASAGGFQAIKKLVRNLPPDFSTPILIVWHMSPDLNGILPEVLNKVNSIFAVTAKNNEEILPNRIYIAKPDYHLLVEKNRLRVTHGPKENRFRPAIDPLFRSAAYWYRSGVTGVVLSGALDDGTAGLWSIQKYGGVTVVQDPADAEMPSMPESAIRFVKTDHIVSLEKMGPLLMELSMKPLKPISQIFDDELTKREMAISSEGNGISQSIFEFGKLTPYTCPECHGVLTRLMDENVIRYRCHTGHAYSADTLMSSLTEKVEDALYNAIRGIDESIFLLNHMGDHFAEINQPQLASLYFKKAKEAEERSKLIKHAAITHEQLNGTALQKEVGNSE